MAKKGGGRGGVRPIMEFSIIFFIFLNEGFPKDILKTLNIWRYLSTLSVWGNNIKSAYCIAGSYQPWQEGLQNTGEGHHPADTVQSPGDGGEDVRGDVRSDGHAAQLPGEIHHW